MRAASDNPVAAFVEPHLGDVGLKRVTLSGAQRGSSPSIKRAIIRPVEVRGERALQIVTYDERRSTTTNVDATSTVQIDEILAMPFRHVVVELTGAILEGRVAKSGTLVSSRKNVAETPVVLGHDRRKSRPIAEDAPFLEVLGISANGRVKPSRQAKYTQINEFIRILDGASALERVLADPKVRVIDFGCGNAYLTFAVYHHLTQTRDASCALVGVDRNDELMRRNQGRAESLGWSGLRFETGDIASYVPADRPHVVIALHACDTASDDALASAVRWGADLALVAPCCHHHVQAQLQRSSVDSPEALMMQHGILRERTGDVVTDTARAAIMRLLGYDVDVIEFVSPDHTPKNLLIRASNRSLPVPRHLVESFDAFTARWSIRPHLADLLGDELAAAGVET